jgi:hypothetical protein
MATLRHNNDLRALEDRELDTVSGGFFGMGLVVIVAAAILIGGTGPSNHQENKHVRPDGNGLRA